MVLEKLLLDGCQVSGSGFSEPRRVPRDSTIPTLDRDSASGSVGEQRPGLQYSKCLVGCAGAWDSFGRYSTVCWCRLVIKAR